MEIPVGFAQANFVFTGQVVPTGAEVTLGLDVSLQATDDDVYSQMIATAWEDNLLPQQTAQITLAEVRIKYGPTATGRTVIAPVGVNGSIPGESEVPNVAALVTKATALGGRAGRGRMYIPGLNQGFFDSGGIASPGNVAGLQAAMDAFGADLATGLATPVVLHGPDGPISVPTEITAFVVQNRAATQRRRLRR